MSSPANHFYDFGPFRQDLLQAMVEAAQLLRRRFLLSIWLRDCAIPLLPSSTNARISSRTRHATEILLQKKVDIIREAYRYPDQ